MRRRAISAGIGGQVGGGEVDNYRGPFVPT
jgi:hypothetical protein